MSIPEWLFEQDEKKPGIELRIAYTTRGKLGTRPWGEAEYELQKDMPKDFSVHLSVAGSGGRMLHKVCRKLTLDYNTQRANKNFFGSVAVPYFDGEVVPGPPTSPPMAAELGHSALFCSNGRHTVETTLKLSDADIFYLYDGANPDNTPILVKVEAYADYDGNILLSEDADTGTLIANSYSTTRTLNFNATMAPPKLSVKHLTENSVDIEVIAQSKTQLTVGEGGQVRVMVMYEDTAAQAQADRLSMKTYYGTAMVSTNDDGVDEYIIEVRNITMDHHHPLDFAVSVSNKYGPSLPSNPLSPVQAAFTPSGAWNAYITTTFSPNQHWTPPVGAGAGFPPSMSDSHAQQKAKGEYIFPAQNFDETYSAHLIVHVDKDEWTKMCSTNGTFHWGVNELEDALNGPYGLSTTKFGEMAVADVEVIGRGTDPVKHVECVHLKVGILKEWLDHKKFQYIQMYFSHSQSMQHAIGAPVTETVRRGPKTDVVKVYPQPLQMAMEVAIKDINMRTGDQTLEIVLINNTSVNPDLEMLVSTAMPESPGGTALLQHTWDTQGPWPLRRDLGLDTFGTWRGYEFKYEIKIPYTTLQRAVPRAPNGHTIGAGAWELPRTPIYDNFLIIHRHRDENDEETVRNREHHTYALVDSASLTRHVLSEFRELIPIRDIRNGIEDGEGGIITNTRAKMTLKRSVKPDDPPEVMLFGESPNGNGWKLTNATLRVLGEEVVGEGPVDVVVDKSILCDLSDRGAQVPSRIVGPDPWDSLSLAELKHGARFMAHETPSEGPQYNNYPGKYIGELTYYFEHDAMMPAGHPNRPSVLYVKLFEDMNFLWEDGKIKTHYTIVSPNLTYPNYYTSPRIESVKIKEGIMVAEGNTGGSIIKADKYFSLGFINENGEEVMSECTAEQSRNRPPPYPPRVFPTLLDLDDMYNNLQALALGHPHWHDDRRRLRPTSYDPWSFIVYFVHEHDLISNPGIGNYQVQLTQDGKTGIFDGLVLLNPDDAGSKLKPCTDDDST